MVSRLEKLRRIATPDKEIHEKVAELEPATELDSHIRDFLHRLIQQRTGAVKLILADNGQRVLNTGRLTWEIVTHEPTPGNLGRTEVSIWVEEERE